MAEAGDKPFGLVGRFGSAEALVAAARAARWKGYTRIEAIAPIPLPDLSDVLGQAGNAVPFIALGCGVAGAAVGYGLQHFSALDFPFVVGGKPVVAWPPFMIVTFAVGVLSAVLGAALSMLLLNGYPRPYHPLFNVPGIDRQSLDGFFLCIEAGDPEFGVETVRAFLVEQQAIDVAEVAP